jgi:hypothetical protein
MRFPPGDVVSQHRNPDQLDRHLPRDGLTTAAAITAPAANDHPRYCPGPAPADEALSNDLEDPEWTHRRPRARRPSAPPTFALRIIRTASARQPRQRGQTIIPKRIHHRPLPAAQRSNRFPWVGHVFVLRLRVVRVRVLRCVRVMHARRFSGSSRMMFGNLSPDSTTHRSGRSILLDASRLRMGASTLQARTNRTNNRPWRGRRSMEVAT